MYFRLIVSIAIYMAAASQAFGADIVADILECKKIRSDSKRIVCYDKLAESAAGQHRGSDHKSQANSLSSVDPEDLFGKKNIEARKPIKKKKLASSLNKLSSQVVRIEKTLRKEYVVHLENGQVWRQKGEGGTWRVKVGDVVVISSAAMGSFLMRVDGKNRSVRAKRLK